MATPFIRCFLASATQIGAREIDRRPLAGDGAKLVDDGVLHLRAEPGVREGGFGAREVDGEGSLGREVLGPVDGLDASIELLGAGGQKAREGEEDAAGNARPEASAQRQLERPFELRGQRAAVLPDLRLRKVERRREMSTGRSPPRPCRGSRLPQRPWWASESGAA
jgi:hypothetical protein